MAEAAFTTKLGSYPAPAAIVRSGSPTEDMACKADRGSGDSPAKYADKATSGTSDSGVALARADAPTARRQTT